MSDSSPVVSLGEIRETRAMDRRGTRDARLREARGVMGRWKRKERNDWKISSRKVARLIEKLREVIFVNFFGVNLFILENWPT